MEYVRLCIGAPSGGTLVPAGDVWNYINSSDQSCYKSIFYYDEAQYQEWKSTRSVAGFSGQTTDKIVWDLDCKDNVEAARSDAKELCTRLIAQGIPKESLKVCFSGNKGFSIEVFTDKRLTVQEHKNIQTKLAENLPTNDKKILDAQRIFRMEGTKHNESGLYKLPLSVDALCSTPIEAIREMAKSLDSVPNNLDWPACKLPDSIYSLRKSSAPTPSQTVPPKYSTNLDFKIKPQGFSNCKYSLLNGFFESGERSNAMMAVAATCKAAGFPKEIAYGMCKSAARLQGLRTNTEPFSKTEIWNNIIEQIYRDTWSGGTFSCKTQDWLHEICENLGENKCKGDDAAQFVSILSMAEMFSEFSMNIEENTIKTGIQAIDENVRLTVGMPVGLLGAPSSGKTSMVLQMLESTSERDIDSAFFSMDMYGPLLYLKKLQRLTGMSSDAVLERHKRDATWKKGVDDEIAARYRNVSFCLKSGLNVKEMRDSVDKLEQTRGRKIKLVGVDYLELISGPYTDILANTVRVASELKDFATETNRCLLVLLQPPKAAGDASQPLYSMRQVKGASMIEQSFRVIFGIYREGFGPLNPEEDKFVTIAALKNTMGMLFSRDCSWNGVRGDISPITDADRKSLEQLRESKKASQQKDTW